MKDYEIILIDGTIIPIKAEEVNYYKDENQIRFVAYRTVVARFNLNNIAGWVDKPFVREKARTDMISIKDAMSVFNDFMMEDVEENGRELFLTMLIDKAEEQE